MKKRITSILLALVLCLGLLPTSVLADEAQPFTASVGEIVSCEENAYTYKGYGKPDAVGSVYTIAIPFGTEAVTLDFNENSIAYNYNVRPENRPIVVDDTGMEINWLAGKYPYDGVGVSSVTVKTDYNEDGVFDFIQVQTPYNEDYSGGDFLYAVTFRYIVEAAADDAALPIAKSSVSYTDFYADRMLPVYTVTVPAGTQQVALDFSESVIAYNYKADGKTWLSGYFADKTDPTYASEPSQAPLYMGVRTLTVPVDADADGTPDFVQVQTPYTYNADDWDYGSESIYALTFAYADDSGSSAENPAPASYAALISGIAAAGAYDTDAWLMLSEKAYDGADHTPYYGYTGSAAPAALATIANSTDPAAVDAAISKLDSFDATAPYAEYTAPYVLMAYAAAGVKLDSERENALLDCIVTALNNTEDEYYSADAVGMLLPALVPYCANHADIRTAVDNGIAWLSAHQDESGSWGNTNSDAMVVTALAACGIDAHTDARFVKANGSAVEALLGRGLYDGSGFGYADNTVYNALATEQGFRALVAYARFRERGVAYNIYTDARLAQNKVDTPEISAQPAPPTPSEVKPTGEAITVYVTIKGNVGDYWLNRYPVTVPGEGATVYHAFTKACAENDITQTGAVNGYVRTLEKSGKTLSEFTNGANSGWLYRVEGKDFPTVGLTSFSIENGDSIIWYYTNDWTVDDYAGSMVTKTETAFVTPTATAVNGEAKAEVSVKNVSSAIAAAKADGAKEIVIAPVVKGSAGKVSVELPKTAVNDIVESSDAALNIQTDVGSIDIPNDTLSEILKAAGSTDIAMSVEKVNPTAVKDSLPAGAKLENAVAVEFSISSGDKTITSFGGKALKVSVPVDAKKFADGKTCTAFVVSADGKAETTTAKIVSGEAVVEMRHFSTVVITDQVAAAAFSDVAADTYYYDAVLWAAGNGVTAGTDDTHFSPNRPCTRAQVVTFLWRAALCPKAEGKTPFTDVAADTYYSDAVTWAYEQGITGGTSATTFSPNTAVTRAQVVTFLYRYEKPAAGTAVNPFADVQKNAYYYDAVQWAYANGITDGTDGTHFSPNTVCTRGQIVTFLYRDFDSELSESSGVEMRLAEAAAYVLKTTPAPRFGSVGGEWAVLGLARSGSAVPESYYADYYTALEKTVSDAKGVLSTRKYTEYSRVIVALAAIGKDARDVAGYDLTMPLGDYDNTIRQGTGGSVWALIALDSRNYPMPICPDAATSATRQMYIDRLLATQNTDGGWGIGAESASDIDMTAMALQALAKYQEQKAAADATERALAFLGGKQDENGGYASSESTAQVIVALCSLGIDLGDIRFIKNGHTLLDDLESYRVSGGGYRHTRDGEANQMASEQALYALAAVQRAQTGMPGLYRMEQ